MNKEKLKSFIKTVGMVVVAVACLVLIANIYVLVYVICKTVFAII